MNKREIEATVRNLLYWLPCPVMLCAGQARVAVAWTGSWFDCPPNVLYIIGEYVKITADVPEFKEWR